jgi:hypothetical protein
MGSVSTLFQLMIQFLTLFHALLKREILTFNLFSELLFVCSFLKSCMCMCYIISALYSYSFCNLLLHLLLFFTHFLEAYCPVRKGDLFLVTGGHAPEPDHLQLGHHDAPQLKVLFFSTISALSFLVFFLSLVHSLQISAQMLASETKRHLLPCRYHSCPAHSVALCNR